MNRTYEEILNSLKSKYFDESSQRVAAGSELEKRFEAVASELFAISCYCDFVFRQSIVQTATGEYLDMHAANRDVTRKQAQKATGTLTFSLAEALENDVVIGEGTICSVTDKPYLQFETTERAVITAGELSADAQAVALDNGAQFNVPSGSVTVMVNAPVGVYSVTNGVAFSGGYDTETDEALRSRVINTFRLPSNGLSKSSVENSVMKLEDITDCRVPDADTPGEIKVYVTTRSGALSNELKARIIKAVGFAEITGARVVSALAQAQSFSLTVDIYVNYGADRNAVSSSVEAAVRSVVGALRIGDSLDLSKVSRAVLKTEGVESFNIYSPSATGNKIVCSTGKKISLDSLAVNCYEL